MHALPKHGGVLELPPLQLYRIKFPALFFRSLYINSFPQEIQVSFTYSLPISYALDILPIPSNQPNPSSSPENPIHPSLSSIRPEPKRLSASKDITSP